MSFLYPRTISIKRPSMPSTAGNVGYQGLGEARETLIASGIPASVQISSSGRNSNPVGLPSDSPGPIKWTIMLPSSALPGLPLIMERDVIYDDLGRRFQVSAYEPTGIGAHIDSVRLIA